MKKLFSVLSLFFICSIIFPQNYFSQNLNKFSKKTNQLKQNLNELKASFNEKWINQNINNGYYAGNGEKSKAPNWKVYKRWEWFWEQRTNPRTGEFPSTNAAAEIEKVKNTLKKSDSFNENWTNLGVNSSSGGYSGIGRINCIEFHPTDANTFWVGSPSGGIWRTTDGGTSWTILNNNEVVLGVSDIAITSDYSTSSTLYIATGDRDGGSMWSLSGGQPADNTSAGVFKSTNGGATWSATGLTSSQTGSKIYSLLIHPTNNNILIASTHAGIYKTTDAGVNWTKTSNDPSRNLVFKPGDPSVIYGVEIYSGDQWFQMSTNTGDTWSEYKFGLVQMQYVQK